MGKKSDLDGEMFALAIDKMVIGQVNYWLSFWQGNKMDRDKGKSTMGQVERVHSSESTKDQGPSILFFHIFGTLFGIFLAPFY